MSTQAKVAIQKQKHPEYYCRVTRCLWRTMICDPQTREMRPAPNCADGFCPRHRTAIGKQQTQAATPKSGVLEWIRNGYQFPDTTKLGLIRSTFFNSERRTSS